MSETLSLFELADPQPDPVIAATPVGEIVEAAWGRDGLATATYDPSGRYRYRWSRVWGEGRRCVFVMLNPSTATAHQLDPTVTRCVGYARAWGYAALEVVNVFAYRSTDPKALREVADPVGDGNDEALVAAGRAGAVVAAGWGVSGAVSGREASVRRLFADQQIPLSALRLTRDGHPGHPLYLPRSLTPRRWEL